MPVRQLSGDDWALYRELRLAALTTDPDAFGSTLERESGFDEEMWRSRVTMGPDGRPIGSFVAESSDGDLAEGTVQVLYTPLNDAPMLVAMWVHPDARGTGAGQQLVDAALDWARDRGDQQVVLWVVRDNAAALQLYERCGFRPTGNTDVLPSNPDSIEVEMIIDLR